MSDSELLQVIYEKVLSMDKEMQSFRNEMQSVKDELKAIHNRLNVVGVKANLTLEKVEDLRLDMKIFE